MGDIIVSKNKSQSSTYSDSTNRVFITYLSFDDIKKDRLDFYTSAVKDFGFDLDSEYEEYMINECEY